MWPLWGEKIQNRPLNKLNDRRFALLPVNKYGHFFNNTLVVCVYQ